MFEYIDGTTAEKEAARVSPDGHNFSDEEGRTFMDVAWIDTPHFLRDGETILLYVGNDATVLDVLYRALGPQFAGGRSGPVGPPAPGDSMIEVPAPIDSVEVTSTNYPRPGPPDYFLKISSGLPIGCVKFGGYEVEVQGRTIIVTVSNIQPSDRDVTCTMQPGIVETLIELGRDFEPSVEYTVVVNGAAAATFRTAEKNGIDRPFEVKLHETATIESQDLSFEFIEVLEDSRCAANVTCIWAGRARVLIGISLGGEELGQHELTLEGGQGDLAVARLGGYLVGFVTLNPYPVTSDQGDDPDYTIILAVSMDKTGANDVLTDPGPFELSLSATPVLGEPLTVLLVAELTGGLDYNRDLYCQRQKWQFGDGISMLTSASCFTWMPSSTIPRHIEQTYTYEKAGVYQVTFTYGPLGPITTTVEVR